ncbi:P-loop containing nucleoside triphosphate hydrolase protein, partial [Roridomyces roridus]
RIAILGPSGMGKTTLATAALHDPSVVAVYSQRWFIPCECAATSFDIAALIEAHLGLKAEKNAIKHVTQALEKQPRCLLILDNLETAWDPLSVRTGVEEFLALLTAIDHLSLIITMRGAERPAKVHWTRPFLKPLEPLSDDAAQQMFIDIADDIHDPMEVNKVLQRTGNMPLAIDLIAHLVDCDGCPSVLSQWELEHTTFLSTGYDRASNLDLSINSSLTSPRFTSVPGTMDLLSLLSILPDGLSNSQLQHIEFPHDVQSCRAVLLATSLVYMDVMGRLKSLVPIQEHMHHFHPISLQLVRPIQDYLFHGP